MEMKHNETKNTKHTVRTMHLHAPVQRARLRHDFDSSTRPVSALLLFTKQKKNKKNEKTEIQHEHRTILIYIKRHKFFQYMHF